MPGSCGQTISDEQHGGPRGWLPRLFAGIWLYVDGDSSGGSSASSPGEEDVRCLYRNVLLGEAGEVGIARDEVVGVRGVEERKEVVIVGVG